MDKLTSAIEQVRSAFRGGYQNDLAALDMVLSAAERVTKMEAEAERLRGELIRSFTTGREAFATLEAKWEASEAEVERLRVLVSDTTHDLGVLNATAETVLARVPAGPEKADALVAQGQKSITVEDYLRCPKCGGQMNETITSETGRTDDCPGCGYHWSSVAQGQKEDEVDGHADAE